MTNMPKLSARAAEALNVLADGGSLAYRLERNSYTGREQFAVRLKAKGGAVVKGVGFAALRELQNADMLQVSAASTSGCTFYVLAKG